MCLSPCSISAVSATLWLICRCTHIAHWGRVLHICVTNLDHHCFRWWLIACSVPSHYLKQCCIFVNWTLRNNSVKLYSKLKHFHSRKCVWNCRLENVGHFSLDLNVLTIYCQWHTIHPKKYAQDSSFLVMRCDSATVNLTQTLQGCFTGTGAIVRFPPAPVKQSWKYG